MSINSKSVDTPGGELRSSPGAAGLWLSLGFASFAAPGRAGELVLLEENTVSLYKV